MSWAPPVISDLYEVGEIDQHMTRQDNTRIKGEGESSDKGENTDPTECQDQDNIKEEIGESVDRKDDVDVISQSGIKKEFMELDEEKESSDAIDQHEGKDHSDLNAGWIERNRRNKRKKSASDTAENEWEVTE